MKILYVEDNHRDADLTVRMLSRTAPHLHIEPVSSVEKARERLGRLASEPLDLVLTDMHLPDGDGLILLKHIRESSFPLAVVVVTGMGDEETAVAALKASADDYVVKSRDHIDRLPVILESAVNHYQASASRRNRPLNVLYAEDNLADMESTLHHFAVHAAHIHLEVVARGSDVIRSLQQKEKRDAYDILLLALHLPELNALQVLRELRVTDKRDIPVVLVCRGDEEWARQALNMGAFSYVMKTPGYLHQLPWHVEDACSRADLMRREAALHASEARNRAILNAIPDLMFLYSPDGTILDYHASDPKLLRVPPEQFLGKNVSDVMSPELAARFTKAFQHASEKPALIEFDYPLPDGARVYEASIVKGEGDKILGIVRDITERRESQESLRKALAEVQQLKDRLHEENIYLQEEIRVARNFGEIVGKSKALQKVLQKTEQVAALNTTVLILGETGTGKELLAHAIHSNSSRQKRTLVKVNCAALPAPLIESELFGHEKGAFTGADVLRRGRFEIANGGTLFLDEVGELPLELQAKLLRVLEEGEFERVGGSRTVTVDVRVIAATNRNLAEAVGNGTFRSDLYYRLSIFPITMPPLRERLEDIPLLVNHLVEYISSKLGKEIASVSQNAMAILQAYNWPGNVRELRNVIERAVIISQGSKLRIIDSLDLLPVEVPQPVQEQSSSNHDKELDVDTLEQNEYRVIVRALKKVHWRVEGPGGAAELLGLNASTLRSKMKKLGIARPTVQTISASQ